jgi:8-hydroxy-5-deazaflavin:NADPH oxidoreductase
VSEEPDRYGNPPFKVRHEQHPEAKLGSFADAAAHGELVVNATAGTASLEALRLAGEANLAGKVLIDIANALDDSQGMPPRRWCPPPTRSASASSAPSPPPGWSRPSTP